VKSQESFWRELDRVAFANTFAEIYEHSPWVAARSAPSAPVDNLDAALKVMADTVAAASLDEQLTLLRAHPDLAGKAALAGDLTAQSAREQAGAGLDNLSAEEMARFTDLNSRYTEKFGFPFIIAVAGLDKHDILAAFDTRMSHTEEEERRAALEQVHRIARVRAERLIEDYLATSGATP